MNLKPLSIIHQAFFHKPQKVTHNLKKPVISAPSFEQHGFRKVQVSQFINFIKNRVAKEFGNLENLEFKNFYKIALKNLEF